MKLAPALVLVLVLGAVSAWAADPPPVPGTYAIQREGSTLTFKSYKDGWFSSLGHDHTIAGRDFEGAVRLDLANLAATSVTLTVKTATFEVLDPGVDAGDKAKIATALKGGEVLDVEKFPEIRFVSTGVKRVGAAADGRVFEVTGDLTLHGVTRALTFAATLEAGAAAGTVRVAGTIKLNGTDYGIQPYGVGLGAVKVKDGVELEFSVAAKRSS